MNSEFGNQHSRPAGWTLTRRSENLKVLVILNNLKSLKKSEELDQISCTNAILKKQFNDFVVSISCKYY